MIAITLSTVAPLILAALPAAAVPQRLWKDDTFCIDKTTETVTVTQTVGDDPASSSTDPEGLEVTGFIETTTETVVLTSTLTVTPTVDAGSLESSDPFLSPDTKIATPAGVTVTVFNTVTDVSTVTVTSLDSTLDLDLPTNTASAVPLPLTIQPYYLNTTTQVIPYANLSLPLNDNATAVWTNSSAGATPTTLAYSGYENGIYFTNWGIYAADYQPQSLPASQITRVIYAFADFDANGTVISSDPYADLENHYDTDAWGEPGNNAYGCVKQLYLLKQQNRQLKVLLSIGGWTYSDQYPDVAANPAARETFASSAVKLITDWGFDGIEIDWEYPSDTVQAANMVSLLQVLRYELDRWTAKNAPGYHFLITIASPAGGVTYSIMDLAGMDKYVDSWNLMAYDYAGSWDTTSGHQANIYTNPNNLESTKFSTEQAVSDYIARGIRPAKIILGMPTFGRTFEATAGIGLPYTGIGSGSPRLKHPGLWLYRELPRAGATEIYDDVAKASYSYDNATRELISYDNVHSALEKKSYVFSRGLGGVVFWEGSGDRNGSDSLVTTLATAMGDLNNQENLLSYPTSQYDNIRNAMVVPEA
ncbi:hypothetical protein VMCG_01553 [Cytospora schulzeri]|uniref:chitinase n=1 Tax=Cytospora schulzeri TaxID=448051 RepID=A0A423X6E3_9PEZI|nr:hypothetical protein VMCG_01553 [Valsa malicola]